jgi:hypothetical protein
MKKGSTTVTMQRRNFSVPEKLTIGLDLGDRNSWCCVVDEGARSSWSSECGPVRKPRKHGDSGHSAGEKPLPQTKNQECT